VRNLWHGCLQLAPQSPALQDAVSQLCCAVWLAKLEGRECVVAQTLPHLVIRALTTGAIVCHMEQAPMGQQPSCVERRHPAPSVACQNGQLLHRERYDNGLSPRLCTLQSCARM
jgi:hypothetical protein